MFNYNNSARYSLESSTLSLLERIDAFVYPLLSEKAFQYNGKELQSATPQYVNLGQLHDTLEVELVDELPEKVETYRVTVGYARREYEKMNTLYDQVRNSFDSARENREYATELERLMGDYGSADRFWKDILDKHEGEPESKTIEVKSKIKVNGDYCRAAVGATPRVRLVNQHRDYAIAMTYIHEMFHAYYDWNHETENAMIKYIEEALVEYAMLRFVAAFVGENPQDHRLLDEARWNVRSKLTYPGTAHYGLGAVLFNSYANAAEWELLYRKAKFSINPQSPTVAQYIGLFSAGSLQDTHTAVGLLLQILAEALNLPMMTIAPTQGMPMSGGTMIGGTTSIPNALQMTIVTPYDPQEAARWFRHGITKVQYHTICNFNPHFREPREYVVFDMLVDDPQNPKNFFIGENMPSLFCGYSFRHHYYGRYLPINRGGVFDPATFSIVGGKWAFINGFTHFITDFIYDNVYVNDHGIIVVCQCRQDMMVVGCVNENGELVTSSQPMIQWGVVADFHREQVQVIPCSSEAVAQSICEIIEGEKGMILIARTKNGNRQMINASGTPLSKEYAGFSRVLENGVIEVWDTNDKYGLVAEDGTEVVAPICKKIFDNKILIACAENGNQQIVDANGTPLSKEYDDFSNVGNGVLMVEGTNGKYGLVAEDGTELFAPIYKSIEFGWGCSQGTATAIRNGKEFILSKNEDGRWAETQAKEDEE